MNDPKIQRQVAELQAELQAELANPRSRLGFIGRIKQSHPEVSNRTLARMLGCDEKTVRNDLAAIAAVAALVAEHSAANGKTELPAH
jgi:hypothetical protein